MKCPLCGYEFDAELLSCHNSCAFNKRCAIICCPNCGYQVADSSKSRLVRAFQRMWKHAAEKQTSPGGDAHALSRLQPGQSACVVSIESTCESRLERLSVFGLTPGAKVTLQQRHPTFVLRVGYTELSLERQIADEIMVQPL